MVDEQGQKLRRAVSRFGLLGVCRATVEDEFQSEGSRRKATILHHNFTFVETGQVVQPIGHIGLDLLELRVVEDGLCALTGFFGGLEKQDHFALVGALLAEPLRQAAEDGGVAVVAAFVRNALVL